MNWLKKGPQLKMPTLKRPSLGKSGQKGSGIKPPAFLADLYYDLRDRRLLLPLALVIVAIAAVPFLLGDSEPVEQLPPVAVGGGVEETEGASASLAVVEAKPGLRDYHKRLDSRSPTNPFKQRYTSIPDNAKVESTSVSSSTGGSGEGSVEIEEISAETVTSPGGGGDGGSDASQPLELVIDAQVRRTETKPDGSEERGDLEVRKNVPVLAKLPGEETPVITLMGVNLRTERLVFLVSHEVAAIQGEFTCATRTEVCELLEVGIGTLLDYTYEPSGAHYEVKVTRADVIPARKRRAARIGFAVGAPRQGLESGNGSVSKIAPSPMNPR
jgi:hypothetical protein